MTYQSLRKFLENLESSKDLIRVKKEVSTILEMTEIERKLVENGGPAVLFENVISENGKSEIAVLANLFGTKERIALALGVEANKLREVGKLLAFLKQPNPPKSLGEIKNLFPMLKTILAMRPKEVKKAQCQEIVLTEEDVDLRRLPIQSCWPKEPAPLITWPLVITKGPDSDKHLEDSYNLGIYRMQLLNKNQLLMRWLMHRGGAAHYHRWKEKHQEPFPVAIAIGASPTLMLAAVTPIPDNVSEYQFAGLLSSSRMKLVKCKTIPLQVPEDAEIILEGHVLLNDERPEGPYGDHTGYYNNVENFPVFQVTAITHRKDPIYMTTFTGKPPDEPSVLGEALNEIFIPLIQQQFSEIVDFYLPPEGCSYRIAVIAIRKSYPGQARRMMMAVWSYLRQFTYTKMIIVVDYDINIRDWKEVMWAVATKMDFKRDVMTIENTPMDYLDFASVKSGLGAKIGFDATNKIGNETDRKWGKEMKMDQEITQKVKDNWKKYGFLDDYDLSV